LHLAKVEMRRVVIARRDALSAQERREASIAVVERLVATSFWREANVVGTTLTFGNELDTAPLLAIARRHGKRVALPRVDAGTRMLELFFVEDVAAQTAPGTWGIREPLPERCEAAAAAQIDLAVIPGVAFDRHGGRLGYGGGFYDRLLPMLRPGVPKVVLAFAVQVVERVPRGPQDVLVDAILTEQETIVVERSGGDPARVR
jgi:5-formyltetrahydrofolate cyclo-ligase